MKTITTVAPAQSLWRVDPTHSHVEFAVRHLMIATVKGRFSDVAATLTGDEANPAESAIELTIPAASIDTREAKRDAHLRSADFFDVEHHPTIHFRSSRITSAGSNRFRVEGELSIRGVTKAIVLTVEGGGHVRDPWGNDRVAYSTTTTINRKDFGLTWNQALETGGVVVGDEVKISVELELIRSAS